MIAAITDWPLWIQAPVSILFIAVLLVGIWDDLMDFWKGDDQ